MPDLIRHPEKCMKDQKYCVCILSSSKNGTLYIGVTNSLIKRVNQHKEKATAGLTEKYNVDKLVYFEIFGNASSALYREKQLKNWRRDWKVQLIEKENPGWEDLSIKLFV